MAAPEREMWGCPEEIQGTAGAHPRARPWGTNGSKTSQAHSELVGVASAPPTPPPAPAKRTGLVGMRWPRSSSGDANIRGRWAGRGWGGQAGSGQCGALGTGCVQLGGGPPTPSPMV